MPYPALSLIVLRSAEVSRALQFYQALGFEFQEEQHGSGPIHYSCNLGATVLEIYPGSPGAVPERKAGGATMLGFRVLSLDKALEALKAQNTKILLPPKETQWGRRATVADPDGRAIELSE